MVDVAVLGVALLTVIIHQPANHGHSTSEHVVGVDRNSGVVVVVIMITTLQMHIAGTVGGDLGGWNLLTASCV